MRASVPAFCLTLHAAYRCRHAGACCEADWHVPAEPPVVALVEARGLAPAGGRAFLSGTEPGDPALARTADGACVFFNRAGNRLCRIHETAGPAALPSACRHFPRVILNDDRGTFIAMSHFCPTAAAMLLDNGPVAVIGAPSSLEVDRPEGLEARGAFPPLLRPGVLMDLEAYDLWERAGIRVLTNDDRPIERSMGVFVEATERLRMWTPDTGPLAGHVRHAFDDAEETGASMPMSAGERECWLRVVREVMGQEGPATVSSARQTAAPVSTAGLRSTRLHSFISRYLAARLFGNHMAYEGRGLRSIVAWLRTCLAVLHREIERRGVAAGGPPGREDLVEAARAADLLLMHELDSAAFARRVAPMEEDRA